jgi:hypothetical protein
VCGQIASIYNSNRWYESGYVNLIIGFNNPGIPVNLDWTITAATDITEPLE